MLPGELTERAGVELDLGMGAGGLESVKGRAEMMGLYHTSLPFSVTNQHQNFNCVTIGLTKAYDAAPCDISFRWICEKAAI